MRKVRAFTLIELMMVVAIIGLLGAIALPSLMNYIRRSQTTEAMMNIRRMYDGAVAYYVGEHADKNGTIQNQRFPGTAGPTPAAGVPKAVKVLVPVAEWKSNEWLSLDFSVKDPQRFQYSFIDNNGVGLNAFAIMRAQGDLNGNGVYSTFERSCTGEIEGVMGGSGLVSIDPTE